MRIAWGQLRIIIVAEENGKKNVQFGSIGDNRYDLRISYSFDYV